MTISPKFISLERSDIGNGLIVAKEFLGEYFIYKIIINGETLRIRTNINCIINIGEKCVVNIAKDSFCFLYPGAHKVFI